MAEIYNHNKNVLISGAAGGLGKATVKFFAEAGYHIIAIDKVSPLQEFNPDLVTFRIVDITKADEINQLKDDLKLETTGLDLMISAAGVYDTFPLTEANPELFLKMMNVNLMGTVNLVQAMLRPLALNKGKVIVVSSESYKVQALFQPYMISKASLEAYCIAARQELSLKGIKLSVVRPGAMNTPLLDWMKSSEFLERYRVYHHEIKKSWERSVKMVGKITPPEKVAEKIFKASSSKNPKRIYLVNNNPLLYLVAWLPGGLIDWAVYKIFKEKNKD